MLKTSVLAVAGGFFALPFSPSVAMIAAIAASAALIAHQRTQRY